MADWTGNGGLRYTVRSGRQPSYRNLRCHVRPNPQPRQTAWPRAGFLNYLALRLARHPPPLAAACWSSAPSYICRTDRGWCTASRSSPRVATAAGPPSAYGGQRASSPRIRRP